MYIAGIQWTHLPPPQLILLTLLLRIQIPMLHPRTSQIILLTLLLRIQIPMLHLRTSQMINTTITNNHSIPKHTTTEISPLLMPNSIPVGTVFRLEINTTLIPNSTNGRNVTHLAISTILTPIRILGGNITRLVISLILHALIMTVSLTTTLHNMLLWPRKINKSCPNQLRIGLVVVNYQTASYMGSNNSY
jgi:hypothetical protein